MLDPPGSYAMVGADFSEVLPRIPRNHGGAEFSEALRGFGPSLLSVLDAMRRSREHRVLTAGTKGGRNPRRRRRRK